jgi:hypothetical protein
VTVTATNGTQVSQGAQLRNFHRQVISTSVRLRNRQYIRFYADEDELSSRGGRPCITSLVILAVLALLGVSTMTATTTELQIANDMEAEARSFQAAEAGLTAAARMILDGVLSPDTDVGRSIFPVLLRIRSRIWVPISQS